MPAPAAVPSLAAVVQAPPARSLLAGSRDWPVWLVGAGLVLLGAALVSIWMGRNRPPKVRVIWTVIALIPILGPLGWFVLGRQRK